MSSYGILHIQKFKSNDIAGIEIHNSRSKKSLSNPDIDYSKTDLNWWPKPCQSLRSAVKNRLDKRRTNKKLRDDAVVMVNAIVTASPNFFRNSTEDTIKQYFLDSLSFLENKYSHENVISAVVHLDEATPHMHISIVPLTSDMRVCAKDLFEKNQLQELQNSFFKEVSSYYSLKRGGDSEKRRHLSENEYKLQKKIEDHKLKEKIFEKDVASLNERILSLNEKKKEVDSFAISLEERRKEDVQKFREMLQSSPAVIQQQLSDIRSRYEKLVKDYTSLRQIAESLKTENENLITENRELKEVKKDYDYMLELFSDDLTDAQYYELIEIAEKYRAQNNQDMETNSEPGASPVR